MKPWDIFLDAMDLAVGVALSKLSSIIGNYGIITVIASKKGANLEPRKEKTR